jgi:hypothetical protein
MSSNVQMCRRAEPTTDCMFFSATPRLCVLLLLCILLCLQRVSEVYEQQCADVQDPQLPVEAATQLVGHMLSLQAEGLSVAQVGATAAYIRCLNFVATCDSAC